MENETTKREETQEEIPAGTDKGFPVTAELGDADGKDYSIVGNF